VSTDPTSSPRSGAHHDDPAHQAAAQRLRPTLPFRDTLRAGSLLAVPPWTTFSLFVEQTLGNLVYSAPFLAPLAYVGVGLLLLLVRLEEAESPVFGWWVVLLALGGFIGNFGMSLLDHAQNGLFHWTEWVPVISAAFGASFLLVVLLRRDAAFIRITYGVLGLQVVVGTVGFVLHATADLGHRALPFGQRFVFGAPAFAPLLFADLAVLAALGLRAMSRATRPACP
jgi:hypothetical protein